jgi:hypothetical protein
MGTYLSTPVTEKNEESGESLQCPVTPLAWGVMDMQGWRKSMEDSHVAQTDIDVPAHHFDGPAKNKNVDGKVRYDMEYDTSQSSDCDTHLHYYYIIQARVMLEYSHLYVIRPLTHSLTHLLAFISIIYIYIYLIRCRSLPSLTDTEDPKWRDFVSSTSCRH